MGAHVHELPHEAGTRQRAGSFLLSRTILQNLFNMIAVQFGYSFHFEGTGIVCALELLMLLIQLVRAGHHLKQFICAACERSKWIAIADLLWTIVPELCTFSAMRLLHFVTPTVVINDMSKFYVY